VSLILDALFSSIALGHFAVDLLNGQRSVLLVYWTDTLGLSNSALALASTLYVWAASLSQPVFGWLTDRWHRPRLIAAGGLLWMAGFFTLALLLPYRYGLICLLLASLGSAAFHPVGVVHATLRGKSLLAGRETTAASMFFLFGQTGFFLGPVIGGILLTHYGVNGLLLLSVLAIPVGVNALWRLRGIPPPPPHPHATRPASEGAARQASALRRLASPGFIAALATVAALQAWIQQNMITFLPKYLSDLGQPAAIYGLFAGLFMGGSAAGNVLGGHLADRYGKQRVAVGSLVLACLPLFAIAGLGWTPLLYLLVPLAGLLTGAVFSILVVTAQRVVPMGLATASGLTLGFMFSAGALGTLLCGPFADKYGWPPLFALTALLALVGAVITAFLRLDARGLQPEVESETAAALAAEPIE
jgi:FSR family fosmidomycin resistance protein-like MFS transporter